MRFFAELSQKRASHNRSPESRGHDGKVERPGATAFPAARSHLGRRQNSVRAITYTAPAPRRHRSTGSSLRTSRAGSSGATAPSGPCRATSRRNSAAISSAASSALDSHALSARAAARVLSWPSPARDGVCATDGVFVPNGDGPPALLRASCLPKTVAGASDHASPSGHAHRAGAAPRDPLV